MNRWLHRLKTETRGQTMAEFALIAPVLLLLIMGMFDFGRVFHAYVTVSTVARETARHAIVRNTERDVIDRAKESAVGLDQDRLNLSVAYGGTDKTYSVASPGSVSSSGAPWNSQPFGHKLSVTASYSCDLLTPLMKRVIGSGAVAMSSRITMALE